MKIISLLGVGLLALGCGPDATKPAVTYVPTHTPGLKYVVVSHSGLADDFGSRGNFSRSSDYLLLCDGRPAEGMHCAIPPEVGMRASLGPTAAAPAPVPEMVGALTGSMDDHVAAPPAEPNAATPTAPIPVPIVLPAPAVHVAPKVGK
jgi:hypothetical protein